ncbi:unnamed protein product, partial [Ceratitis capitata]
MSHLRRLRARLRRFAYEFNSQITDSITMGLLLAKCIGDNCYFIYRPNIKTLRVGLVKEVKKLACHRQKFDNLLGQHSIITTDLLWAKRID